MPADPWQVSEPVFAANISLLSLVWVLFLQNSGIGGCCQWWMSPCLCTSRIQSIPSVRRRECSMCAHPWGHWDGVWAGLGGLDSSNEANRYKKEPSRRHSGALYSLVRRQIEFRCHFFPWRKQCFVINPKSNIIPLICCCILLTCYWIWLLFSWRFWCLRSWGFLVCGFFFYIIFV